MHAGIPPTPGADTPLGPGTPLEQTPSWEHTPPGTRHPLGANPARVDTPRADPPGTRHPPQEQTPPLCRHHPCAVHAGRYGQQAGGMHPTGMQSCFTITAIRVSMWNSSLLDICKNIIQTS